MASILVAYGTGEGQTAKVAHRIESVLADRGHDVTTVRVSEAVTVSVDDFDAVVVGSPVNYQRHLPAVVSFVRRNRESLAARPSAFFQLSFASAVPLRSAREGAMDFVDRLTETTGWRPDRVGLFGGAVAYTRYGRLTRLFFRIVSAVTTGDTDVTRDYEYTDWDAVERFALEFADDVDARRDRTAPTLRERGASVLHRRTVRLAVLCLVGAGVAFWVARGRSETRGPPGGAPERWASRRLDRRAR